MDNWWEPYLDAWNRHDGAGVAAFMAENGSYEDVALGVKHTGRADIAAWIDGMVEELSTDYGFEPVTFQQSGSSYAMEWVMSGTNDRSSPMLPATGKPFRIRGISVGELDGAGRIQRNTDYWDMAGFLVQVGILPAPEAATA